MGLLDLFRRKPASPATPVVVGPPTAEEGIPGNANFSGRLMVEPNAALRDTAGFGRAGSYEFGEWDAIARSNPFVASGLDFVMGPIRGARLDVEEPNAEALPDEATRKAMVAFLRWNLTEKLTFPMLTAGAAEGFLKSGFSLFEPVFAVGKHSSLPGGQGFYLAKVSERLPNSLHPNAWLETPDGALAGIRQYGPRAGGWADLVLPVDRVLLFSWQRSGNNWSGRSAFRAVWYIAGRVMPELLKLVGVTYQREGAGIPVASATDANTPLTAEQRDQLVKLLAGLVYHEGASAVLPAGWKLDWVFSGGANKGHVLDAWKELGTVVLQQVGAQQLALGTGSTGSRSVGEVHDARAMAYVRSVISVLEAVLNGDSGEPFTGLVKRMIDANWGPQVAYPRIKLTPKRPELDPKTRMEALGAAKSAGFLTVTAKDENDVRAELGLSPIDEAERDAARAKSAALVPVLTPGKPDDDAGEEPDPEALGEKDEPAERMTASAPRSTWAPWRPLRASESKLKLADMDRFYSTKRDEFERRIKPLVVGMLAKAAPAITEAMKDGNPSEVASLPLDTKRLEAAVKKYLNEVRAAGAGFAREELTSGRTLTAAAEEEDKDPIVSPVEDADEVIEAQTQALTRRMTNRLRADVEREAIDALQRGGDGEDVVSGTVESQLDSGAFRSDAGFVTTRAFSVGREEAARLVGGVASVERSAILDSNTCSACSSKDGQTADFNSDEHDALLPPDPDCDGGDNCRCLLVYVPADQSDDGGDE